MPEPTGDDADDDALFEQVASLGALTNLAHDDSLPAGIQDAAQTAAEIAAADLADRHRRN
ncbi:hypothetical protein ACIO6U_03640 [Streptomyces sp. NPDC087422]|uniref:hypothetical protein n=1 Tax=Streptomyces sp. NPDC087422 TaxID=3365786 RepID=UPI0038063C8F